MTITTDEANESALAEIELLMRSDPALGTADADRLELLASAVHDYESIRYPIGKPSLVARIRFRLEQRGWFESR